MIAVTTLPSRAPVMAAIISCDSCNLGLVRKVPRKGNHSLPLRAVEPLAAGMTSQQG